MKAHRRRRHTSMFDSYRYNVALSTALGMATMLACMCISSILVSTVDVPNEAVYVLNCVHLGIGCYTAGYTSATRRQKSGIVSGSLCGLLVALSIVILSAMLSMDSTLYSKLCKVVVATVCGAIGGIRSANSHSI